MVGTRITGFGSSYLTTLTCPACDIINEIDLNLDGLPTKNTNTDELPAGVTSGNDGTFSLTLPTTGYTVEVKLLNGAEERRFAERLQKKRKNKLPESTATDMLKSIVTRVEGRTDVMTLHKVIDVMPVRDTIFLRRTYEKLVPNVALSPQFECEMCNFEGRVEVPLSAEFFWPE